jgi:hypothetical protein
VKLNPQRGAARGRAFVSAKAVDAHLRYLQRDGVTKDGEKGQVYSAEREVEDGRAFVERGREDRHQFRFIVSAGDGVELADPGHTTRDLMKQINDLARARLIAVDHHNFAIPSHHRPRRDEDGKTATLPATTLPTDRGRRAVVTGARPADRQEVARSLERRSMPIASRGGPMLIAEQRSATSSPTSARQRHAGRPTTEPPC